MTPLIKLCLILLSLALVGLGALQYRTARDDAQAAREELLLLAGDIEQVANERSLFSQRLTAPAALYRANMFKVAHPDAAGSAVIDAAIQTLKQITSQPPPPPASHTEAMHTEDLLAQVHALRAL